MTTYDPEIEYTNLSPDGKLSEKGKYLNNMKTGKWITFDKYGITHSETEYIEDLKHGEERLFSNFVFTSNFYVKGINYLTETNYYDANGIWIKREKIEKVGKQTITTVWLIDNEEIYETYQYVT